jgi:IclR family transcriptional regulator, KDG regulon repressor
MDKTAVKLLRLYEHLCRADAPLGVSALAARLRLTKSNTHRILRTLTGLGYAQQTADGHYSPTLKAWELGTLVINRLDFVQVAKPYMHELNVTTGESVYLATLNGTAVVYLDVLESRYPIRINATIGGTAPAHCSASGKLLLAYNPLIAAEYLSKPLEKFTARTVTRLADVQQKLEAIRRAGYSINDEEWVEGVCGVSAPIHDGHRLGIAAIGITALKERVNRAKLKQLTKLVTDVARKVSVKLGYRAPLR